MLNEDSVKPSLPKYKCHKEVSALKIKEVIINAFDGSATIIPSDKGYGSFRVDEDYMRKHRPKAGGYYIVYNDGYKSYSPSKAFEEGYTLIES